MRNQYKNAPFSLQLFGEGATGETGADAALQQNNIVTGEPADSQPQKDSAPSREEAFESLIRGEYKDLYEKRVSQIVQKRLAKQKQGKPNQEEAVSQTEEQEQSKMPSNTHVLADAVYEDLSAQARNLGEVYPSFDLAKDCPTKPDPSQPVLKSHCYILFQTKEPSDANHLNLYHFP